MIHTEISRLRSFGQLVEVDATRSLHLLKAIDDTLFACHAACGPLNQLTETSFDLIERLKRVDSPVDENGSALKVLENGRAALARAYEVHQARKRESLEALKPDESDGVVEAYDELLDAIASAHNAVNALCWALGEHDADYDEVAGTGFTSADELIHALRT